MSNGEIEGVMFWLGVSAAYLVLIGVGLVLGHWLASRHRGWGRGRGTPTPVVPVGPTHGAEVPGLGSAFDRAFLPGVQFGDLVVSADAR